MFKLTFETDNAAFTDDAHGEVGRILREVAKQIERGCSTGRARDGNGNTVGEWSLKIPDGEE